MYVSIDIGGTNTRVASFESLESPNISNKLSWVEDNMDKDISLLISSIHDLTNDVKAIGIGITERTSDDIEVVEEVHKSHKELEEKLVRLLSDEFNCPIFLQNDAVVASLAVASFGEGKGLDEFVYITWGTGIGGSHIIFKDNKLQFENLNWNKYFMKWESKCGGRFLKYKYSKSPDELTLEEWIKVLEDFVKEYGHFQSKFKNKKIILGGGIAQKKKSELQSLDENISITNLGDNVGLFGGAALIKNQLNS